MAKKSKIGQFAGKKITVFFYIFVTKRSFGCIFITASIMSM